MGGVHCRKVAWVDVIWRHRRMVVRGVVVGVMMGMLLFGRMDLQRSH